jgi:hypothetical protein
MKTPAFFAVATFALLPAIYAGPEQYSPKEVRPLVEQTIAPQWYADNEWNVSVWGTYVFTDNGGEKAPRQGITLWTSDRYLGADDAWGGGIDLKYFFHRYFGLGIEGYGLAVHRDAPQLNNIRLGRLGRLFDLRDEDRTVGAALATLTLRFPVGRFAPYVFGGGGALFGGGEVEHIELTGATGNGSAYGEVYRGGDTTAGVIQFGAGLEVRFTRHIGWMGDFSWNVVDGPNNNFGMARTGLNFAF